MPDRPPNHPRLSRLYWNLRLLGLPQPIRDLWLFLLSGIVVWSVIANGQQTDRTTHALCALRHDLEDRVAQTDKFLREHPEGFAGIPAGTLRVNEQGQIRTVGALSGLRCSKPSP